jgi:hypothetical protein
MAKAAPNSSELTPTRCWALDIGARTMVSPAQKPNSCHACGYAARVPARFHPIHGNLASPDRVQAAPIGDSQ